MGQSLTDAPLIAPDPPIIGYLATKSEVMNNAINKDLVILALKRENEQLKRIEALYQKKEENTNKMIENYEIIIEAMKKQLQKEREANQQLNAKIDEITASLQTRIDENAELPAQQ